MTLAQLGRIRLDTLSLMGRLLSLAGLAPGESADEHRASARRGRGGGMLAKREPAQRSGLRRARLTQQDHSAAGLAEWKARRIFQSQHASGVRANFTPRGE